MSNAKDGYQLTLVRPDDWHVHLRDGGMMRAVLPYTAEVFARAVVMPNLRLPVSTSAHAAAYRDEILEALPEGVSFEPLMTLYLNDETKATDLDEGYRRRIVSAVKLYPANATTNAEHGVSEISRVYPILEWMQRSGMPLLIHGEVTDRDVDVFDREEVFIDRVLIPLRRKFSGLKIVLEHITTAEAATYVEENGEGGLLSATITAHHLWMNRNAMLVGGIRPHYYCLPVLKREKHRQALIKAATSGRKMFFLGTDTAPHSIMAKECSCGCAGVFSAPYALELYAQCFDEAGKLENLEAFASRNGPAFYGLPVNRDRIILHRVSDGVPEVDAIKVAGGERVMCFAPPSPLRWRVLGLESGPLAAVGLGVVNKGPEL